MLQAIELHNNEVGQISADKMCFLLHDNDSDDEVMATDGELQSILLSPGGGDKNYLHKKGFFSLSVNREQTQKKELLTIKRRHKATSKLVLKALLKGRKITPLIIT